MNHLTQDEIKKLLREIPNERQRLMFKVGFLHGLRISELINLTRENIRDGYVSVQRLKGSKKTVQPFVNHPDSEISEVEGLTELFGTLKAGELVFPITRGGAYKLMQRAGKRAGLPEHKLHPHVLKHSCAMKLIGSKIGIEDLRVFLGHASLNSTGAYLKVSDETASKAAMAAFSD